MFNLDENIMKQVNATLSNMQLVQLFMRKETTTGNRVFPGALIAFSGAHDGSNEYLSAC